MQSERDKLRDDALTQSQFIEGWLTPEEAEWLFDNAYGRDVVVEFGCYLGKSTSVLCNAASKLVITVDNWMGTPDAIASGYYSRLTSPALREGVIAQAQENLRYWLTTGRLRMIKASTKGCPSLIKDVLGDTPIDMVFIDADHEYFAVCRDIVLAQQMLRPGGLLCGHDYKPTENADVVRAVNRMLPHRIVAPKTSIWYVTV